MSWDGVPMPVTREPRNTCASSSERKVPRSHALTRSDRAMRTALDFRGQHSSVPDMAVGK
jgi:hypothetical protein